MTYVYRKPDGTIIELQMTDAEKCKREGKDHSIVLDDGTVAKRALDIEYASQGSTSPIWDGHTSTALGVGKKHQREHLKHYAKHGITGLKFNSRGDLETGSKQNTNRCIKARNWHNLDGGYGDA